MGGVINMWRNGVVMYYMGNFFFFEEYVLHGYGCTNMWGKAKTKERREKEGKGKQYQ